MQVLKKIGILIALSLLISACDTAYGPEYRADGNPAKLRGKQWAWVGYTTMNGGYLTNVPEGNYIEFLDSTVEGVSGCNGFLGSAAIDRSLITSHDLISTALGCPGQKEFLCALDGKVQYHQRDSMLVLVPESGDMVHLFFKQR